MKIGLDQRGQSMLHTIASYSRITGKELEKKFHLSRKQVSYSLGKINDYLQNLGYPEIQKKSTGELMVDQSVRDAFREADKGKPDISQVYTDRDRRHIILVLLLNSKEELSVNHFTYEMKVSKNTMLNDLKKVKSELAGHHVQLFYSRKEGYTVAGSEYEIRGVLLDSIRRILKMEKGTTILEKICKIDTERLARIREDISTLERTLDVQFTDQRLYELPYLLYAIFRRIGMGSVLTELPDMLHHVVGTKEYLVCSRMLGQYEINNLLEKMYITSQIQISRVRALGEGCDEQRIQEALELVIEQLEGIYDFKFQEREALMEALMQHCVPAFYRIRYQYHIDNSIVELILPQYQELHEAVRQASRPFAQLVGNDIPDDELVYITALFGSFMSREGLLGSSTLRKRAIVVCANGVTVSNYLFITMTQLFPEIDFLATLSVRNVANYRIDYDIVFSTVPLQTEKQLFIVDPMLTKEERELFRKKVMGVLELGVLSQSKIQQIIQITSRHATIHNMENLQDELELYFSNGQVHEEPSAHIRRFDPYGLTGLLTAETIKIADRIYDWKEAIELTSLPLLYDRSIKAEYIQEMIRSIETDHPYIMLADGFVVAHASPEDGVNRLGMSMMILPERISICGYMMADIIMVLATPDRKIHLNALNQLIDILEDHEVMAAIRKATTVEEILSIIRSKLSL